MKKFWGKYFLLVCLCLITIGHAQENDYGSVGAIANACYQSLSSSPSAQALVDQTFIRPKPFDQESKFIPQKISAHTQHAHADILGYLFEIPQQVITSKELTSKMRDLRMDIVAIQENEKQLVENATRTYLSQSFYNWMVFEKIFQNLPSGPALSARIPSKTFQHPKVQQVFNDVASIFDSHQATIRNLSSQANLNNEIEWINPIIMQLNKVCSDRHPTYMMLQKAYQNKTYQNFDFNPGLERALYPNGIPHVVSLEGDINAIIRNRMRQERNAVTEEASLYRFILSQTSMGYLLNTKTDLQDYVGRWSLQRCLEEGRQLNTISDQAELLIPPSVQQVRSSYQSAIRRISTIQDNPMAGEVHVGKSSREILEQYIQENPTSIQMALLSSSDEGQALSVCSLIHRIKSNDETKEALQPLIVIGATLASAFVGPEMLLLINASWLTTSVGDLVHSYGMEDRIKQAILSGQISALRGQELIQNLQTQRPYSYLNIALAGAGTVGGIKSVQNSMKIKAYDDQLSVRGGSTESKFNEVQPKKITNPEKTTTINAGGKLTATEISQIENWLSKQTPKTEGAANGASKKLTKSNDLDLFANDTDGGAITFTKPKAPSSSTKAMDDVLQGTGVVRPEIQLGFVQPKKVIGFENHLKLDPVFALQAFPLLANNMDPKIDTETIGENPNEAIVPVEEPNEVRTITEPTSPSDLLAVEQEAQPLPKPEKTPDEGHSTPDLTPDKKDDPINQPANPANPDKKDSSKKNLTSVYNDQHNDYIDLILQFLEELLNRDEDEPLAESEKVAICHYNSDSLLSSFELKDLINQVIKKYLLSCSQILVSGVVKTSNELFIDDQFRTIEFQQYISPPVPRSREFVGPIILNQINGKNQKLANDPSASVSDEDHVVYVKAFFDSLMNRDSDYLSDQENDQICELLEEGIPDQLLQLFAEVLEKYNSQIDCPGSIGFAAPAARVQTFEFNDLDFSDQPFILNTASNNHDRGPPADQVLRAKDYIPFLTVSRLPPIPYAVPASHVEYQKNVRFGDPIDPERMAEQETLQKTLNTSMNDLQTVIEMVMMGKPYDAKYNALLCRLAYYEGGEIGSKALNFVLQKKINCASQSYKEVQEAKRTNSGSSDELNDPNLVMLTEIGFGGNENTNYTDVMDVLYGVTSYNDNVYIANEVCNLLKEAISPTIRQKAFQFLMDNKIDCRPQVTLGTHTVQFEEPGPWLVFTKILSNMNVGAKNDFEEIVDHSVIGLGNRSLQLSNAILFEDILYAVDETYRVYSLNPKNTRAARDYIQRFLDTRGRNLYSLRDNSRFLLQSENTEYFQNLEPGAIHRLKLDLPKMPRFTLKSGDGNREVYIKFEKTDGDLKLFLFHKITNTTFDANQNPYVITSLEIDWAKTVVDTSGHIYLFAVDGFANKYVFTFMDPKYESMDAAAALREILSQKEYAKLNEMVVDQCVQLKQRRYLVNYESCLRSVWTTLFIAYEMKNTVNSIPQTGPQDEVTTFIDATNADGFRRNLTDLFFTSEEISTFIDQLKDEFDFFVDYSGINQKIINILRMSLNTNSDDGFLSFKQDFNQFTIENWSVENTLTVSQRVQFLQIIEEMSQAEPDKLHYFAKRLAIEMYSRTGTDLLRNFMLSEGDLIETSTNAKDLKNLEGVYQKLNTISEEQKNLLIRSVLDLKIPGFAIHTSHKKELFTVDQWEPYPERYFINILDARLSGDHFLIPARDILGKVRLYFQIDVKAHEMTVLGFPTLEHLPNLSAEDKTVIEYYRNSDQGPSLETPVQLNLQLINNALRAGATNKQYIKTLIKLFRRYIATFPNERTLIVPGDDKMFDKTIEEIIENYNKGKVDARYTTQELTRAYLSMNDDDLEDFIANPLSREKIIFIITNTNQTIMAPKADSAEVIHPDEIKLRVRYIFSNRSFGDGITYIVFTTN